MNAITASTNALTAEIDRLLNPANFYAHPKDVLRDEDLSLVEKRAILSSWASDYCAVDSRPELREYPGSGQPVSFDDIMSALQELDDQDRSPPRRPLWETRWPKMRRLTASEILSDL